MKAIVLVAGYASRLYPLTLNKPKALLTLNKTTLLDFLVKKISYIENVDWNDGHFNSGLRKSIIKIVR